MRTLGVLGGRGDVVIDEVIYALFCVCAFTCFLWVSFICSVLCELGWEFGHHSVDIS